MDYKLEDIIDIPLLQNLQDKLNLIYSFPSAIIDNEGKVLTAVAWQDICTKFHRMNPECEQECIKSDMYILDHLHEANPAVSYQCPHGLTDNATPIIIEGKHYGNFFTGQFFLEEPDPKYFRKQAKIYGFDEKAYLEAVDKVPVWTREKLGQYLDFIKGFIEIIAGIGLRNLKEIDANKVLKESEEKYRRLFERSKFGIFQSTPDGKVIMVNPAFAEMFGYDSVGDALESIKNVATDVFINPERRNEIMRLMQENPDLDTFENLYRRKDGSSFTGTLSTTSVRDFQNQLIYIEGFIEDITLRRHEENEKLKLIAEVKEERAKLSVLINSITDEIWFADTNKKFILANPSALNEFGLNTGNNIEVEKLAASTEVFRPDGSPRPVKEAPPLRALAGETVRNQEEIIRSPASNEMRHRLVNSTPVRDQEGKIIGVVSVVRDITEIKHAEENIRRMGRYYQAITEKSPAGIALINSDGKFKYISSSARKIFGYDESEEITDDPGEYTHPEDLGMVLSEMDKIFRDDSYVPTIQYRFAHKNGSWKWIESTFSNLLADPNVEAIVINFRDITERKLVELALRESEKKYRLLADNITDMIWLMDFDLKTSYISPSIEQHRGFTLEEIQQMPLEQNLTPASYQFAREIFSMEMPKAMSDPSYAFLQTVDLEYYRKNGTTFWLECLFSVIRDNDGKPVSILGVGRDITEHKQTVERLRESEAKYRLLADHMTDTIWLMDLNLNISYISPSVEKRRGFSFEELQQMPLDRNLTPSSYQLVMNAFSEEMPKIMSDPTYSLSRRMELEFYCKNGTTVWLENMFTIIRDEIGNPISILGEGRDITERKLAEEALRKSEEKFRTIFENIQDVFYQIDLTGTIQEISPSIEHFSGFTRAELIGSSVYQHYFLGADRDEFLRTIVERGKIMDYEIELIDKNGEKRNASINATLIFDTYGKPNHIVGVIRDITARKQAEKKILNQLVELQRWQEVTLGREDRNRQLKRQVNELLLHMGEPIRYPSQEGMTPEDPNNKMS
jgi:PAS domain S-box-containing protein